MIFFHYQTNQIPKYSFEIIFLTQALQIVPLKVIAQMPMVFEI